VLVQQLSVNEASPGAMAPGELERDPPPGAKKNGPKDWSCQYCDDDLEMNACLQMSHWLGGLPVGNLTFVLDQNLDYQFDRQKASSQLRPPRQIGRVGGMVVAMEGQRQPRWSRSATR